MAISPFKTWNAGDVLTASDLNASFTQITSNGQDVPFPRTKDAAMAGFKLTMDAAASTWVVASTTNKFEVFAGSVSSLIVDGSGADNVLTFKNKAGTTALTSDGATGIATLSGSLALTTGGVGGAGARTTASQLAAPFVIARAGAAVTIPADTNEDTVLDVTVPASALGTSGYLRYSLKFFITNNANAKTIRGRFSTITGTVVFAYTVTSFGAVVIIGEMWNTGSAGAQLSYSTGRLNNSGAITVLAQDAQASAIDTTAATHFVVTCQKGTAGDTMRLDGYLVELIGPA